MDCSKDLEETLEHQGFDVASGTVGLCTGVRKLPSQVYEKDIFIYDPGSAAVEGCATFEAITSKRQITDSSPQFSLEHLKSRIENGATFLTFANRVSTIISVQNAMYSWIPFMPSMAFTEDRAIIGTDFSAYPASKYAHLTPIATPHELALPVLVKMTPPEPTQYENDVFWLFGNGNNECLGVLIRRGRGHLIVLPRFISNSSTVETFLNRVVPTMYQAPGPSGLLEIFVSPREHACDMELARLLAAESEIQKRIQSARADLSKAEREKVAVIRTDQTGKQILVYYDQARRQPDAALFYLYKIIESIENKFGGEAVGIAAVGAATEWKSVKRLANESYMDARHAPKPTEVIKKWTNDDIKRSFEDTQKVVTAYFATLFK